MAVFRGEHNFYRQNMFLCKREVTVAQWTGVLDSHFGIVLMTC